MKVIKPEKQNTGLHVCRRQSSKVNFQAAPRFQANEQGFFFFFGLVGFYIYVAFILLNYAGFSMTHDFRTALEE